MSELSYEALEMSDIKLLELDPFDWIWKDVTEQYALKIIHKANELGLSGKKIKQIVRIDERYLPNGRTYIDFVCEDTNE